MDLSTGNNAWVDSYLDALMSCGLSFEHTADLSNGPHPAAALEAAAQGRAERGNVAQKYYVRQLLGQSEESIRDAWAKASRPSGQRDSRLQYVSWRAWSMKRKRAAVARRAAFLRDYGDAGLDEDEDMEAAATAGPEERRLGQQAVARRRLAAEESVDDEWGGDEGGEEEEGPVGAPGQGVRRDTSWYAAPAASERLASLAESPAAPPPEPPLALESPFATVSLPPFASTAIPTAGVRVSGAGGVDPLLVDAFPRLYIVLVSLHGLVRGNAMELGRDADTGGQIKYVVELARALGRIPSVARVDLLTRLVADPAVHASYSVAEESLSAQTTSEGGASGDGRFGSQGVGGAFVVRLPCGPNSVYLRKEDLWPHVREFADRAIEHVTATLSRLHQETGEPAQLYMVHGHYADGGEVAACMSLTLGIPMALTGHSLGRNKREHLLKGGAMTGTEIEAVYRMSRRIEAEERALGAATVVFASTQQEVQEQWGMYDGYGEKLAAALLMRPCRGYHVPVMKVVPPGLEFSNLKVKLPVDPWEELLGSHAGRSPSISLPLSPKLPSTSLGDPPGSPFHSPAGSPGGGSGGGVTRRPSASTLKTTDGCLLAAETAGLTVVEAVAKVSVLSRAATDHGQAPLGSPPSSPLPDRSAPALAALMCSPGYPEPPIWREVFRFLRNPRKPVVLAMCRPDKKKNVVALIQAYGGSPLLRSLSNLVLILGNRDVLGAMDQGSQRVLESVLKVIDEYDLYGQVAYPKHHTQGDISDIYLLVTSTKGVFVNAALQEPFGLTLIEAAAHGAPIVATSNGGPVDIVNTLGNGVLVDPSDTAGIATAIISVIANTAQWDAFSNSGSRRISAYSWPAHCARCLRAFEDRVNAEGLQRGAGAPGGGAPAAAGAGGRGTLGITGRGSVRQTFSLSYDDLMSVALQAEQQQEQGQAAAGAKLERDASQDAGALAAQMQQLMLGQELADAPLLRDVASAAGELDAGGSDAAQCRPPSLRRRSAHPGSADPSAALLDHDDSYFAPPSCLSPPSAVYLTPFVSSLGQGRGGGGALPRAVIHQRFVVLIIDVEEDVLLLPPILGMVGAESGGKQPDPVGAGVRWLGGLREALVSLQAAAAASREGGEGESAAAVGAEDTRPTGVGIMVPWSIQETRLLLEDAGVDVCSLAFVISDAGAMLWHVMEDRSPSGGGAEASLQCDEEYERHIDFRWDAHVVKQVLRRITESSVGWGKLQVITPKSQPPPAPYPGGPPSISLRLLPPREGARNPFHLTVEVGVHRGPGRVAAAASEHPPQQQAARFNANLLLSTLRRKLRRCGVRANLLLTPNNAAPSASGTNSLALHVTPLRGSRALALRFMSYRHRLPLTAFTLLVFSSRPDVGLPSASSIPPLRGSPDRQNWLMQKLHKRTASAARGTDSLGLGPLGTGSMDSVGSGGAGRGGESGAASMMERPVFLAANDGEAVLGGLPRVVVLEGASLASGSRDSRVAFAFDAGVYEEDKVAVVAGF